VIAGCRGCPVGLPTGGERKCAVGFTNLMLKSKVLSGGLVRILLVVALAAVGVVALRTIHRDLTRIDRANQAICRATQIEAAATHIQSSVRGFLLTGVRSFLESNKRDEQDIVKDLSLLKNMESSDKDQVKLLNDTEAVLKDWKTQTILPMVQLGQHAGKDGSALSALQARDATYLDRLTQILGSFKAAEETQLKARRGQAATATWYAQMILVAGALVIAVVSLSISSFLADSITRPVREAMALAESIGNGDLSGHIQVNSKDEIGRLGTALDRMAETLRNQTLQTLEAVTVLSGSAAEISATAAQLSTGASRTSSALVETSTTVEEVKQAAKVSSQQAKSVAETARQAVEVSQAGLKATSDTIHRMNQIKEQMQSIGETVVRLSDHSRAIEAIIGSVQDIADQSNLLAVNASIEAARAGDQGKGFAVVAVEIKALADQSKAATGQVRSILDDTKKWVSTLVMATEQGIKAVDAGVAQSSIAGESIEVLSRTVATSAQSAALIDASAEQQFVGVERVSGAVSRIEQALNQNLAGTNELETSARRLEELGGALKDLVKRYRI
jgi:methyl-accepting chemotaxis protein